MFNAERKALQVMGLGSDATLEIVKAKYKALVKQHHPDANGGDRSTEDRLIEIIKAYNYLKTVVRGASLTCEHDERDLALRHDDLSVRPVASSYPASGRYRPNLAVSAGRRAAARGHAPSIPRRGPPRRSA